MLRLLAVHHTRPRVDAGAGGMPGDTRDGPCYRFVPPLRILQYNTVIVCNVIRSTAVFQAWYTRIE